MRKMILLIILAALCCCTRRPLGDKKCPEGEGEVAMIPVSVDWSISGFDSEELSKGEEDYIHRVTFRFFPHDGSAPFDRYLEDNVNSGTISIPIGEYSVVVFNEAINDPYWRGAIVFENVDSYDKFAARIEDEERDKFDFYTPQEDENLSVEALRLASYSVDNFVVTKSMSLKTVTKWNTAESQQIEQLNPAVPRPLTCDTTIEVDTENLKSAYKVRASLSGLAQRVFMASGETDITPTTHITELTERSWHSEAKDDGIISEKRLTFTTPSTPSTQTLKLDVLLIDGSRHMSSGELTYDVTDQILQGVTRYADNDLKASVELSLPEVSGDVEVVAWGDDNVITIN